MFSNPASSINDAKKRFVPAFCCLYLLGAVFGSYWLSHITNHQSGFDFDIYYDAYLKSSAGNNPYIPYNIGTGFVYHPFALTFLSFFSWHGNRNIALTLWTFASILSWLIALTISLRFHIKEDSKEPQFSAKKWAQVAGFLFLGFAPFLETIYIGQINLFVALLLGLCLHFSETQREIESGFVLALAIVLKTSPVIFIVYFLVVRKFRVVASSSLFLLLFSAIAAIQFSSNTLLDFFAILPRIGSGIYPSNYNESILSVIYLTLDGLGLANPAGMENLKLIHKIALGILCLALFSTGLLIPEHSRNLRVWLFLTLISVMVFFSPLVWLHHSIFLFLPIVILMRATKFGLIIGILVASLIQLERAFEYVIVPIAFPVLVSHLLLMATLLATYFKSWKLERNDSHVTQLGFIHSRPIKNTR